MSSPINIILSEGIEIYKSFKFKDPSDRETEFVDLLGNIVVRHQILGFVDNNDNVYLYLSQDDIIAAISSKKTKDYFIRHFLSMNGSMIQNTRSLLDFLNSLEALCTTSKIKHHIFRRVGSRDGKIYFDLGNDKNEVIEIDEKGYRVIDNPPVIFLRDASLSPLPNPIPDRKDLSSSTVSNSKKKHGIMELKQFLNCDEENSFDLLVCYLVHLLFPENYDGAKVILGIEGQAGSSKTTFTRVIKSIIDPSPNDLLELPHKIDDIRLYVQNHWLLAFDNISYISQSMSDKLCRLATTAGFSTRKLYTDNEIISVKAKRCIIVNGISSYMRREDLLDRCIMFNLPALTYREPEENFWKRFNAKKPEILGSLFEILAGTLKNLPNVSVVQDFRMSDFCKIGLSVEEYLGWEGDTFYSEYRKNLEQMAENNLYQNVISHSLIHYIKKKCNLKKGFSFEKEPAVLFKTLRDQNFEDDFANPEFPKDLGKFSRELSRLIPTFKKTGISIERTKHSGKRWIKIKSIGGIKI